MLSMCKILHFNQYYRKKISGTKFVTNTIIMIKIDLDNLFK